MTLIFAVFVLPETKGTTPEELRDEIVRSLSMMLVLSNDSTATSSVGNPIDVEWRRAMSDLRRQEEDDMRRGTYSESGTTASLRQHYFLSVVTCSLPLNIPPSYRLRISAY